MTESAVSIPRAEHPRPQFVRESWMTLNGEWEFEFDDADAGLAERWFAGDRSFSSRIQVPFAYQSPLSGIGENTFRDTVWYKRTVRVPDGMKGKRYILHFGAVDYIATVWVNGELLGTHEGGHTPFSFDATPLMNENADNTIVVRAHDFNQDVTIPRGKQFWKEKSWAIWYTRTTGIWQPVWMEAVDSTYLERVTYTPDIDTKEIGIRFQVKGAMGKQDVRVKVSISFEGEPVADDEFRVLHNEFSRAIRIEHFNDHGLDRWWTPHRPSLYDVTYTVTVDGKETDRVTSYFGMRKISIENGKLCLNNRPYFMRLVLDQGYHPEGVLTFPTDDDMKRDVELTKAMGFNGARKHQKVEDPRYLYWADKLGLLVWGEMANAGEYTEEYVGRITNEWQEAMKRDMNHPCIVAWVPINESWGVPNIMVDKKQQHHASAMYHLTKSLDSTRPVVSNDGWEMVESDLTCIHDYEWRREVLEDRFSTVEKANSSTSSSRKLHVGGHEYAGQPIIVSEFGGIAFKKSDQEGWGYSGASDEEDFLKRLRDVVEPLVQSPVVQGFCYTQLTDVEQEINGLLTYDRTPKAPLERIRDIIGMPVPHKDWRK
ncbi:glycoside hydrolase family 2 protein [Paenibacillus thermotolerans]|uniref:glycoside hydrolase family 2 protein n=1 Tax=Paenibacillus thermotolerans TaxID=3027807 RepID=UPI002367AF20|nr:MULTISPECIES: sugar-binding domain-containing protein [unclassified Paenibacillus]